MGKRNSSAMAQELACRAFEEPLETKRISMANKALVLDADCTDAYVILAREHKAYERRKAEELYRQAIAAGRRVLGADAISRNEKDFWNDRATRPYMRAVFGLADLLQDWGDVELAIEQWHELLRLDPLDNQHVRQRLVPCLVTLDRYDEALALMNDPSSKPNAAFAYSLAFMLFKQNGNTAEAHEALRAAIEVNTAVIHDLLQITHSVFRSIDDCGMDEQAEAKDYVMHSYVYWEDTEGALDWVANAVNATKRMRFKSKSLEKTFPGLNVLNPKLDVRRLFSANIWNQ